MAIISRVRNKGGHVAENTQDKLRPEDLAEVFDNVGERDGNVNGADVHPVCACVCVSVCGL